MTDLQLMPGRSANGLMVLSPTAAALLIAHLVRAEVAREQGQCRATASVLEPFARACEYVQTEGRPPCSVGTVAETRKSQWWKKILFASLGFLLVGVVTVTVFVEREADYTLQSLGGEGKPKALILYHPSRDAHFTDDLSIAVAEGLKAAGYSVDRATLTGVTPDRPKGYRLLVVVSNTYFWTPDLPTLRYLARARLDRVPTVGVIAGAGSTTRSQQILERSLSGSGAALIGMQAFWIARPNDEHRLTEPNREVALQLARQLGFAAGTGELAPQSPQATP